MCVYLLVYDILEYSLFDDCDVAFKTGVVSDLVWGLSRMVSMNVWIIPIIYNFWPTLKRRNRSTGSNTANNSHR